MGCQIVQFQCSNFGSESASAYNLEAVKAEMNEMKIFLELKKANLGWTRTVLSKYKKEIVAKL